MDNDKKKSYNGFAFHKGERKKCKPLYRKQI